MPPDHRSQHHLQHPQPIQPLPTTPTPRHRIHHIPDCARRSPAPPQRIIQLLQHPLGLDILAHLEELDAHLPRGRIPLVEFACRGQDDGFDVVGGLPVGDDDDVQRLDVLLAFLFQLPEIRAQDGMESASRRGASSWLHAVEDGLDVRGRGHVAVPGVVAGVQEVDVDAVGVVGGADGRDGFEGLGGFAPRAAGHAAGVIDEEDGVEGGEEGEVGVFDCVAGTGFGSGRGAGWRINGGCGSVWRWCGGIGGVGVVTWEVGASSSG